MATQLKQAARIDQLERDLSGLKNQIEKATAVVRIATLAPEPFVLRKEVPVVLQSCGDEFLASFFDANINAQGSNETEAVANLKDVMLGIFEHLSTQPPTRLGPAPKRQLAVLREFIQKTE